MIESRWGARFSTPVQTGPRAHPTTYTVVTGSFPGVKWPGRGVDHTPPSSAEVKERVELYLFSLSGPSWPVLGWALPLALPLPLPVMQESKVVFMSYLSPWATSGKPGNLSYVYFLGKVWYRVHADSATYPVNIGWFFSRSNIFTRCSWRLYRLLG
jgi:hypothetical protein